jgi:thiosulfate/3-mercaptopyruvate sulfurtransferase
MSEEASQYNLNSYIVTPHDLDLALRKNVYSKLSTAPRIIPLCASWYMPNDAQKRTGMQAFKENRIPHARFFDLDAVKDDNSPYPHMLPTPERFAEAMGQLGVRRDDSVVVYDSSDMGIFSAPRVAWTLKVFGHSAVHILNNYKLWVDQGYPIETEDPQPVERVTYPVPELDKSKILSFEQLKEKLEQRHDEGAEPLQVLDARSEGRWKGKEPEPRPGTSQYFFIAYYLHVTDYIQVSHPATCQTASISLSPTSSLHAQRPSSQATNYACTSSSRMSIRRSPLYPHAALGSQLQSLTQR